MLLLTSLVFSVNEERTTPDNKTKKNNVRRLHQQYATMTVELAVLSQKHGTSIPQVVWQLGLVTMH